MSTPKMAAIRAVFTALFDAVDVAGDFDEDKWIDLIAAFNATGRLVLGFPHLESSEADIFEALEDVAGELEAIKSAIEAVTKDARSALFELHQALDPLTSETSSQEDNPPPDDKPTGTLRDSVTHSGQFDSASEQRPIIPESIPDEPIVAPAAVPPSVAEEPSRDRRGPNEPVAGPSQADISRQAKVVAEQLARERLPRTRQGPRYDREKMFAAIRATPSLADAAAELGLQRVTLLSRLDTLQGHAELPDDILAKRPRVGHIGTAPPEPAAESSAEPSQVDKFEQRAGKGRWPQNAPDPHAGETFNERRIRMAHEATERTWRERHPETA